MAEDVAFFRSFLTHEDQRRVVEVVRGIEPGFYVPKTRWGQAMRLRMLCLGHHWSARDYRYHPTRTDVDGLPCPPIPEAFQSLARRALLETGYLSAGEFRPFDIVVVNHYAEDGRLGDHVDNSESPAALKEGYPILSLSIGSACVFRLGGIQRNQPYRAHVVESGDALIFGRSMRLAYHGVKKLLPGTTPPGVGLAEGERLNLTFRMR